MLLKHFFFFLLPLIFLLVPLFPFLHFQLTLSKTQRPHSGETLFFALFVFMLDENIALY